MFLKSLLLLPLLAIPVLPARAQKPPSVKMELRLLAFGPELPPTDCFAQDPAAPETAISVEAPIRTYLNHQFSTVSLTSRRVVFTEKPDRASLTRDGETLIDATLPEGVRSAILLVVPGKPGDKAKFRAVIIDDSEKAFPVGSYHATNLSAIPIRLVLEKKTFDFPAGKVLLIEKPPFHEGNMSSMRTFAFQDNAWKPVSTGLWARPVETRGVLVFYQDPGAGTIQLRAYDDIAPRAPAAKETTATP
jgi:hypothetical protein